jgi:hypothetical protein
VKEDARDHLDAAGDALEAAAAEMYDEWLECAVEALRTDLASIQGFETVGDAHSDGGRSS